MYTDYSVRLNKALAVTCRYLRTNASGMGYMKVKFVSFQEAATVCACDSDTYPVSANAKKNTFFVAHVCELGSCTGLAG
jgi:hypothetical protein